MEGEVPGLASISFLSSRSAFWGTKRRVHGGGSIPSCCGGKPSFLHLLGLCIAVTGGFEDRQELVMQQVLNQIVIIIAVHP